MTQRSTGIVKGLLFNHLEFSRFNDVAIFIAQLKDINTPIEVGKRNEHLLISNLQVLNFFANEIKDYQSIRLIVIF